MMDNIVSQWPLLAVICAVVMTISMVTITAMCVCMQGKQNESSTEDVEMATANGQPKKSKRNKESRPLSTGDVQLRDDQTQVNGSVPVDSNGRPKSHEDRALPEIPNANGDMQSDDEETDAGHYDVISRTQPRNQPRPVANGNRKVSGGGSGRKQNKKNKDPENNPLNIKKNHAYEKVTGPAGELDSDSTTYATAINDPTYAAVSEKSSEFDPTYAGVKDDTTSDSTYAGVKDSLSESSLGGSSSAYASGGMAPGKHPYATVVNIGEAEYAQISEKKSQKKKSKNSKHKKTPSLTRGSDTMDSIAPPPPVPDKILDPESGGSRTSLTLKQTGSPNLPPRNSGTSSNSPFDSANLKDIPYADEVVSPGNSPVHQASPSLSQTGAMGAAVSMNTSITSQQSLEQGGASSGKREPPYSKVTARESLDELRRRQALEPTSRVPSEADPNAFNYESMDYDQINYEMVKSPAAGRISQVPAQPLVSQQAGDRASLSSDLYAEIGSTAEAMQSQRSSTYARVSELPRQGTHAPTPPPVETLRHLSHLPKHDELPKGGYHQVKDTKRPSSVCSTGSSNYNTVQDVTNYQQNMAEYAVVDKSKKAKKRQTVHVSENLSQSLKFENNNGFAGVHGDGINHHHLQQTDQKSTFVVMNDTNHLYAQVNKSTKRRNDNNRQDYNGGAAASNGGDRNDDNVYDNENFHHYEYEGTGARPKEYNASNGHNGQKSNPSYHHNHKKSNSNGDNDEFTGHGNMNDRKSKINQQRHDSHMSNNNNVVVVNSSDQVNSNRSPIIMNKHDGLAGNSGKVAAGYQTIGGVTLPQGDPIVDDPDYDTVEDSRVIIHTSDHDPNYESLPGSATGMVLSTVAAAQASSVSNNSNQTSPPAVATAQEINMNPDGANQSNVAPGNAQGGNSQNWRRREHIYQEIQDAKNENIYTPDPTSHPRRHGEGASGLDRKSSQQYITNL